MIFSDSDQKQKPTVSIGMPVFNGQDYVAEAIESILAQSFSDFELIISDNASIDRTESICRRYALADYRVRYVRQISNIGVLENFGYVVEEARGQFFMWAACDDRWHPAFIMRCVDVLMANDECVSVFSHYKGRYLDSGEETTVITPTSSASEKPFVRVLIRLLDMSPNMIYGLHRSETLRSIGVAKFDWYDVYLTISLAAMGKILIVPDALFVAGAKTPAGGGGYSLTGEKISLKRFRHEVVSVITKNFSGVRRLFLLAVVLCVTIRAQFIFDR